MSRKQTTTSGLDWNTFLGLSERLKRDGHLRDYLLITMGCYFGLRISDLLSIEWDDVLKKTELSILESKTGKTRLITFNPKVIEAIDYSSDKAERKDKFIFSNRWGGKLTVSYVNKRLKVLFKKYNVRVQNPSSHTLRKTFGKRVYDMDGQSERSLIYLSEIFSHSSTSITRRYIGITQEQIKDVYLGL